MLEFSLFVRNKFMSPIDPAHMNDALKTIRESYIVEAKTDSLIVADQLQIVASNANGLGAVVQLLSATQTYDMQLNCEVFSVKGSNENSPFTAYVFPLDSNAFIANEAALTPAAHSLFLTYVDGRQERVRLYYDVSTDTNPSKRRVYILGEEDYVVNFDDPVQNHEPSDL